MSQQKLNIETASARIDRDNYTKKSINMEKTKEFLNCLLGHYWLILISCILLVASIVLNISHVVITKESIVITFVGILASIIVIGNLAHVTVMKTEMTKELEKLKEQQKTMETSISDIVTQLRDAVNKKEETKKENSHD